MIQRFESLAICKFSCITCLMFLSPSLGLAPISGAQIVRVEAAYDAATDIGVAKSLIRWSASDVQAWRTQIPLLRSDRMLYPANEPPRLMNELGAKLAGRSLAMPHESAVWFLFKGDEPFELTLAGTLDPSEVVPRGRKPLHRRLMNEWWKAQQRWLKNDSNDRESFPPYLQTYLMSVHARRMGMRLPKVKIASMAGNGAKRTVELLVGRESLRQKMFWRVANESGATLAPDFDLPAPIQFEQPVYDNGDDDTIEIEPIAARVPGDCFYIRFGKYSNLMWFQHFVEEHAANIGRLVTLRGTKADYGKKLQSQLSIETLPFAELIGDRVIADVALIGRDLFFREGAAIGLILQENAPVVGNGLMKTRRARAAKDDQVTLQEIQIADAAVSFLSSPDHRVRSYYVEQDGFHLITNCRWIVDRFLRLDDGVPKLSEISSFRNARREMPLDRRDTMFAFFSPRFFAGLFTPEYRIEMQRRLRASCELDLVHLASLAWTNEVSHEFLGATEFKAFQRSDDWLEQLSTIRLLPPSFADREDRSRPVVLDDEWVDSRRGMSGHFLPIPDTPVTKATSKELADYQALSEFHSRSWPSFDPIVMGLSRARAEESDDLEQLTVDARLVTSSLGKYDRFANRLGEPTSKRLVCDPPMIASFQASLTNRLSRQTNTVFWGALDREGDPVLNQGGLLGALELWRTAPAFLAVTDGSLLSGKFLDRLRRFDEKGYFQGVGGLWRRKFDSFTTLSYHRPVLEEVTNTLRWEETNEPFVQARLSIGCLEESQLAEWLAAAARDRGQRSSIRNVRLIHGLMSQLAVDGEDAKERAEKLVGARLMCPLGGEYELRNAAQTPNADQHAWMSTAWSNDPGEILAAENEFTPAVLRWCHGLEANLRQIDSAMSLHAELMIHRQPEEPAFEFSPLKFFSGKKPKQNRSNVSLEKSQSNGVD